MNSDFRIMWNSSHIETNTCLSSTSCDSAQTKSLNLIQRQHTCPKTKQKNRSLKKHTLAIDVIISSGVSVRALADARFAVTVRHETILVRQTEVTNITCKSKPSSTPIPARAYSRQPLLSACQRNWFLQTLLATLLSPFAIIPETLNLPSF